MIPVITDAELHNRYAGNCRLRESWHPQLMAERCYECELIASLLTLRGRA